MLPEGGRLLGDNAETVEGTGEVAGTSPAHLRSNRLLGDYDVRVPMGGDGSFVARAVSGADVTEARTGDFVGPMAGDNSLHLSHHSRREKRATVAKAVSMRQRRFGFALKARQDEQKFSLDSEPWQKSQVGSPVFQKALGAVGGVEAMFGLTGPEKYTPLRCERESNPCPQFSTCATDVGTIAVGGRFIGIGIALDQYRE